MLYVRIEGLHKSFARNNGQLVPAVAGISIDINEGEFVVLLGPSGCGKTTLLRCIAGLEEPDSGRIEIGGALVYSDSTALNLPPERRNLSMLFQSYALWPHMTVFENVAYPLRCRKREPDKIKPLVREALERVECGHLAGQHPGEISGGQQQRIALARALVSGHKVMLFDEPLSNVDAQVRDRLRTELRQLQKSIGFCAIYVTHDQSEAMALADRVVVLREGMIDQVGPPREVYFKPASLRVAEFLGGLNAFSGKVAQVTSDEIQVDTGIGRLRVLNRQSAEIAPGTEVTLGCRPESLEPVDGGAAQVDANRLQGVVTDATFLGAIVEYTVAVGAVTLKMTRLASRAGFMTNSAIAFEIAPQELLVLA